MIAAGFRLVKVVGATACVIALSMTAGCDSGNGPLSGRVIFDDGSPVQSGSIEFRAVANGSRFASRISSDGRFYPKDDEGRGGLPTGEYEIVVVQIVLTEDLAAHEHSHGHTVPRRYADYHTSKLRVTIDPQQREEIEIKVAME